VSPKKQPGKKTFLQRDKREKERSRGRFSDQRRRRLKKSQPLLKKCQRAAESSYQHLEEEEKGKKRSIFPNAGTLKEEISKKKAIRKDGLRPLLTGRKKGRGSLDVET